MRGAQVLTICMPTSPMPQTMVWLVLRRAMAVRKFFLTPMRNNCAAEKSGDAGDENLRQDELPGIPAGLEEVVEAEQPDGADQAANGLHEREGDGRVPGHGRRCIAADAGVSPEAEPRRQ